MLNNLLDTLGCKKLAGSKHKSVALKYCFFKHYAVGISLAVIIAVVGMLLADSPVTSIATVAGALLSILYFIQKQRLEELKLFRELFKEFNERYKDMNKQLAEITSESKTGQELDQKEEVLLIDYFNLCAEEYLYFKLGYVDPVVWQAWENGMNSIIKTPRVEPLWNEEKKSDSYYGLSL